MTQIRLRTILVAVADPASGVQPAVERGARLAKATGARLVLFHAAFDSALSGRPFFDSPRLAKSRGSLVSERERLLDEHADELTADGINVDVKVTWEEPPHEAIVRAALRAKADLVVAGRHEPAERNSSQFRLTDWELMRQCPRPLLVVHPTANRDDSHAVLAALDPTHRHDKPADLDVSIVRHAALIAAALGVECHAVHSMAPTSYPRGASAAARKRFDQRMSSRVRRIIRRADADVAAVHIVQGSAARSVPALASQLPAQMLAMGIVSRRWVERFVIGDTAESAIREVPCDLLLIKPDDFRLRLGRIKKEAIVLPKSKVRR